MEKSWYPDYVEQIRLNNEGEAVKVLLDNIPKDKMIFRYCKGLNRDIEFLNEHKIWLSSVFYFNDPYDCLITVDCGLKDSYPPGMAKEALEIFNRQVEMDKKSKALQCSCFVLCFSEDSKSFPLWGYYAAEHRGICIGYNLYELIQRYHCMPVIYSNKLITYKENDKDKNILESTLTKSDEWMHEKEWRIVIHDENNVGKPGIIKNEFPSPREMYLGSRQQETIKRNNVNRKEIPFERLYANIDDIISYADKNYVDLYLPIISRKEYKMIDKGLILNK